MKHFIFFISLAFLSALTGCQKNVESFVPDSVQTSPDTEWKSVITTDLPVISLKNELRFAKVADSFAYSVGGVVYNSGNLSLAVPPNSLATALGAVPAGNIVRQSLLIEKKGDLISMGMPTVSNDRLLISGGAFFLSLKNHNDDLSVTAGNSLTVKYANTTTSGMKVYNGTDDIINGFGWQANTDVTFNKVNIGNDGYEVLINRLQWIQAAYIFDTTGIPQTTFSLKLPDNYTNANTTAYISFNDMQCVAGMTGVASTKKFISGNLPVNRPVTIVVISKQANDYYLGVQQTVIAVPSSGAGTQEIAITPTRSSFAGVRAFLNNL